MDLILFHREKEKKLEEMKSQKTEYKEGFWNVNTVLLGGLGKDPVLEGRLSTILLYISDEHRHLSICRMHYAV